MTYAAVYHTHTWRCQHAEGDVVDYVAAAEKGGCLVLGASDHMPTPDGRWAGWRMTLDQIDDYAIAVRAAARAHPRMRVLLAFECEYLPEWDGWYREELFDRLGCDYLIGAVHLAPFEGDWVNGFDGLKTVAHLRAYVAHAVRTIESGLFAFIAHPDAYAGGWTAREPSARAAARDIAQAAAANGMPLELNALGLRKAAVGAGEAQRAPYPWLPFWEEAAAFGITVVLNSDAHSPAHVLAGHRELKAMLKRYGLVEADPLAGRAEAARKARGVAPVRRRKTRAK